MRSVASAMARRSSAVRVEPVASAAMAPARVLASARALAPVPARAAATSAAARPLAFATSVAASARAPVATHFAPLRRKELSPARVSAELSKHLKKFMSEPIVRPDQAARVLLLADLVDFYAYIDPRRASRSPRASAARSGGATGDSQISVSEREYFSAFSKEISGDELMSIQSCRDFLMFRYRALFRFSVATYSASGFHEAAVASRAAKPDELAYAEYILVRLNNLLQYFRWWGKDETLLH